MHICLNLQEPVRETSGTHLVKDISLIIQIRWKFHFALIQVVGKRSLSNFAYDMTAVMPLHVQNFVAIWYPTMELH